MERVSHPDRSKTARRSRPSGCAIALAVLLFLLAWYGMRLNGPWEVRSPAVEVVLPDGVRPPGVGLWMERNRTQMLLVVPDGPYGALRVMPLDARGRLGQPQRIGVEELRAHAEPFDDSRAPDFTAVRFHGVALKRPRPYLFLFPGPGGPGIDWELSLFGRTDLVELRSGRVLVSRWSLNGDALPTPFELVHLSPDRRLVAVLVAWETRFWLFRREG